MIARWPQHERLELGWERTASVRPSANALVLVEMATRLSEVRVDHDGTWLPEGVYALVDPPGEIVSYKVRWREQGENGVERQRSKSFGCGSRRGTGYVDCVA